MVLIRLAVCPPVVGIPLPGFDTPKKAPLLSEKYVCPLNICIPRVLVGDVVSWVLLFRNIRPVGDPPVPALKKSVPEAVPDRILFAE